MNTPSVIVATHSKPRLRGFALVSVMIALMLTLLLEALDQTIVGTAMPRIIAQLHGLDRYSWVVTAYILASMTMIPIVGKLSDQFGRKWFLLCGTLLFLLGSILAGASQDMNQLILFRGLQGLGAGIGMALVATVIGDLFPPEERAKWMSLFGIVYGVSNLVGPTLGGWLAEHGPLLGSLVTDATRWRWVFYINLPVGLIAVAALLTFLPANLSGNASARISSALLRRIDLPGAMLFAVFLFAERKALEPVLPLDLFRNQIFSVGALLSLLQMMVLLGFSLYLPLFFQGVLAVSPTSAGLVMTPFSMSMVLGAVLSSMAINRLKRYRIIAIGSALLMSAGALLIALMTPTTSLLLAILFMVLAGIGTGTFFTLPMVAVQNAVPESRVAVSTAGLRYLGQLGATLGIAIVGTAVTSAISGNLMSHLPTSAASRQALSGALTHGFVAVMVFALIALVATFFLKDRLLVATQENRDPEKVAQADEEPAQELICA